MSIILWTTAIQELCAGGVRSSTISSSGTTEDSGLSTTPTTAHRLQRFRSIGPNNPPSAIQRAGMVAHGMSFDFSDALQADERYGVDQMGTDAVEMDVNKSEMPMDDDMVNDFVSNSEMPSDGDHSGTSTYASFLNKHKQMPEAGDIPWSFTHQKGGEHVANDDNDVVRNGDLGLSLKRCGKYRIQMPSPDGNERLTLMSTDIMDPKSEEPVILPLKDADGKESITYGHPVTDGYSKESMLTSPANSSFVTPSSPSISSSGSSSDGSSSGNSAAVPQPIGNSDNIASGNNRGSRQSTGNASISPVDGLARGNIYQQWHSERQKKLEPSERQKEINDERLRHTNNGGEVICKMRTPAERNHGCFIYKRMPDNY